MTSDRISGKGLGDFALAEVDAADAASGDSYRASMGSDIWGVSNNTGASSESVLSYAASLVDQDDV
ncbi:hypothetical protein HN935_02430 [archaeon]|jgi:hypothetical protein|nr:hypothetical protein [archaeon]